MKRYPKIKKNKIPQKEKSKISKEDIQKIFEKINNKENKEWLNLFNTIVYSTGDSKAKDQLYQYLNSVKFEPKDSGDLNSLKSLLQSLIDK